MLMIPFIKLGVNDMITQKPKHKDLKESSNVGGACKME